MEDNKNIENLNWEIKAKFLNNEANSHEISMVESWLSLSDANQNEIDESRKMLNKIDTFYEAKKFKSAPAWKNVHSKINPLQITVVKHKKERKEVIAQFYKYAAIIVIAILLGSVGYFIGLKNHLPAIYSKIISTDNQVVNNYLLPDGTVVALNSNSQLTFPKKFKGNTREVTIKGEAFFDVKPNPNKPFIINAGKTQVKVLGTSFSVCAYPETEKVEVVVKTGKVELIQKNNNSETTVNHIFLMPGEKGVFFNTNYFLDKSLNNNPNFLAWKTHDLIFNEIPLSEVITCLEKSYHVEILLKDDKLNDLLYTAHFDKKPIRFILDVIQMSFDLELTQENEQFTLSSRKNKQIKL